MWSDLQQRAHWGLSFEAVKTWLPNEKERDTSVQRETVFIPVYLRREAALVKQLYRHRFSFSLDVQLNLLFFFSCLSFNLSAFFVFLSRLPHFLIHLLSR